ncbi:MAG: tetratricopeptide repeat protein [Planctomycetes bacterium]|nr:tetratricopeptide repeat protein [Planctomycetota bacterium]
MAVALGGAACGRDELTTAAPATSAALGQTVPTFVDDVAPLVHRHCAPCHRPGQSGPFALLTYRDVQKRSGMIVDVTASGYMPPWLPVQGAVELVGERYLGAEQKDLLRRWHEAGAPLGDPERSPAPPEFPSDWRIGAPDLVVRMPDAYVVPAEGRDVFRNFVIPLSGQLDGLRFVTAVEIRPGNPRVAHHGILMVDAVGAARERDSRDPEPGFPGMDFASAEPPDGHFLGWTPGKAPYVPPPDMAFALTPDQDLVLQLHMVTTGRPERVQAEIGFRFGDRPPARRPVSVVVWSEDIDIPPGEPAWPLRERLRLPCDVDALAVYPHAHYLGQQLHARAILPDGSVRWLLRIDDWSFDWQDEYRYARSPFLPAGTVVEMDYVYDNSAANLDNPNDPPIRVRFGDRSVDEMGTLTLQVVPRDPADRPSLERLQYETIVARDPRDWLARDRLGVMLGRQGLFAPAEQQLRAALAIRPDAAVLHNDLGWLLLMTDRAAAAEPFLRTALQLDPDDGLARRNLAEVLVRAGRDADARRELEEWLRRHPDSGDAHGALGAFLAVRGRFTEALPLLQRAVALRPGQPGLHNDLANTLLFGFDRPADAEPHYRRALAARPDHFAARLNLGRALLGLGRVAEARVELQRARALRPDDAAVAELLRSAGVR